MRAFTSAAWALALFSIAALSSEENTLAWVGAGTSDLGLLGAAAGCFSPAGASADSPAADFTTAARPPTEPGHRPRARPRARAADGEGAAHGAETAGGAAPVGGRLQAVTSYSSMAALPTPSAYSATV